jgi:hypothetical protein
MKQDCFIVDHDALGDSHSVCHPHKLGRHDTRFPYLLGMCAQAVEAECSTAADVESKLEELEDMYQVRENVQYFMIFVAFLDVGVLDSARFHRTSLKKLE